MWTILSSLVCCLRISQCCHGCRQVSGLLFSPSYVRGVCGLCTFSNVTGCNILGGCFLSIRMVDYCLEPVGLALGVRGVWRGWAGCWVRSVACVWGHHPGLQHRLSSIVACVFPIPAEVGSFYYGSGHPMKPQRLRMTHNLILNYGLYKKMEVYRPHPADFQEMVQYHSSDYIGFLSRVTPDNMSGMMTQLQKCTEGKGDP